MLYGWTEARIFVPVTPILFQTSNNAPSLPSLVRNEDNHMIVLMIVLVGQHAACVVW